MSLQHAFGTSARRALLSCFALALVCGAAGAQPAVRLTDRIQIQTRPFTTVAAALGTELAVSVTDQSHGWELWLTDGTSPPRLLKDICPGLCDSRPLDFVANGGRLFFVANDRVHGEELWVTDGTAAGTRVLDITPGLPDSFFWFPALFSVGETVFFLPSKPDGRTELWMTDGTEAGTRRLRSFGPNGFMRPKAAVGDRFLFQVGGGPGVGTEPWVSDGTEDGTLMLKDINPGGGSSVFLPDTAWPVVNGLAFFPAHDSVQGSELWVSDGTPDGTRRLRDIFPGPDSSEPQDLIVVGDTLYFSADDGVHGRELWRSDGTEAGTVMVEDVRPGAGGSGAASLTGTGDRFFFVADDGTHGFELWRSDGTEAGTALVEEIGTGANGCFCQTLTRRGSGVMFFATDATLGQELWASDGTAGGTLPVSNFNASQDPTEFWIIAAGEQVFIDVWETFFGPRTWKSDGTVAGTLPVPGFAFEPASTFTPFQLWEDPDAQRQLSPQPGRLLFVGSEEASSSLRVFSTDGNGAPPAVLAIPFGGPFFLPFRGFTLFQAQHQSVLPLLTRTDGTPAGTVSLDVPLNGPLVRSGDHAFFSTSTSNIFNPPFQLWKTDGTQAGTTAVLDLSSEGAVLHPATFTDAGGRLFFRGWNEVWGLWTSDGTTAGTVPVADFGEKEESAPAHLTSGGQRLFFSAATPAAGRELWMSDGTPGGTAMVKDIQPGTASGFSSLPRIPLTRDERVTALVRSTFYFVADDGASGEELWKSDGTEAGTVRVKDIFPGPVGSSPRYLTRVRNLLFFVADDGEHGRELWRSDGTEAGTVMVADLAAGSESSLPQQLTAMQNLLLFSAWDPVHGREPWNSDGTAAGTARIQGIAPGAGSSNPLQFTLAGDKVYFIADDQATGYELWALHRASLRSTFADVPASFWAWRWIEALFESGITGGCGNGSFCPDPAVNRAEVAVFLTRAARGVDFVPPPATGTLFGDVPAGFWAAAWIEQLAADGVTGGCGGGNYCPGNPLTRAELAVLLLRARFGSAFLPPAGTGMVFADVPTGYWARDWIEHLVALGITGGCGGGNYCPERPVTRAEMAVFVARTFELPTP